MQYHKVSEYCYNKEDMGLSYIYICVCRSNNIFYRAGVRNNEGTEGTSPLLAG